MGLLLILVGTACAPKQKINKLGSTLKSQPQEAPTEKTTSRENESVQPKDILKNLPNNFKDLRNFYQSNSSVQNDEVQPRQIKTSKNKELQIRRGELKFTNLKYRWNGEELQLLGDVGFNSREEKTPFILAGIFENGTAPLQVVENEKNPTQTDSSYKIQTRFLKARATCYDAETQKHCTHFFVDFYYATSEAIFTDQIIPHSDQSPLTPVKPKNPDDQLQPPTDSGEGQVEKEGEGEGEEGSQFDDGPGYFVGSNESDIYLLYPDLKPQVQAPVIPAPQNPIPETPVSEPPAAPTEKPLPPPPPSNGTPAPVPPSTPKPAPFPPAPPQHETSPKVPVLTPGERPKNQAFGRTSAGALINGTSLYEAWVALGDSAGFRLLYPQNKNYYGTWDMIELIKGIATWAREHLLYKLAIGDISSKKGGRQAGHRSHQNGLDADIAYFDKTDLNGKMASMAASGGRRLSRNLDIESQWRLFRKIYSSGQIDMLIVEPVIKTTLCQYVLSQGQTEQLKTDKAILNRIFADPSHQHANHFHMRLKCGSFNEKCFQVLVPNQGLGCK